ncbi:MAG: 1-deoxy-D-xylulose-5-phosphate reductoisomerase [Erysipelotrichaceae bacterium]|jgi:1-deoxy-D-xylulose-5-phosphate reductoisomerase|nr:1-deoxy-D-xylulose-5-phosphate reductoisomerase [Erysipelotrichaceae bacterium]
MKKICLLGASGSIGEQSLDVIDEFSNEFQLVSFSVGYQVNKIDEIISKHNSVQSFYLIDSSQAEKYKNKYPNIKIFSGENGIVKMIETINADMVINALVGFVGLIPSITALKNGLKLALANKESLVVGGELIKQLLKEGHGELFPIDSEHSAIWKCLLVDDKNVKDIILTASGGAFRNLSRKELLNVKPIDALKHPTWNMGNKITIDSATMINKCFEIIEAYYLFGYAYNKTKVILHDESEVHSMVKYKNGMYRAEVNKPDMKNPIRFALFEGKFPFETVCAKNYHDFGPYHFHHFSLRRYPLVRWSKVVIKQKGLYGTTLNAANEVAVNAFLNGKIQFLKIEQIVDRLMLDLKNKKNPSIEDIVECDRITRLRASQLVELGDK